MTFATDFDDMLPQVVTVKTVTGRNGDGSANFSTATSTYQARVVNANKQTRDDKGNVVQAAYVAWIASTSVLSPRSRYALPDGSTPPVLNIAVYPDESGNYYNKVTFGHG